MVRRSFSEMSCSTAIISGVMRTLITIGLFAIALFCGLARFDFKSYNERLSFNPYEGDDIMPPAKQQLIILKTSFISIRSIILDCAARARRSGDKDLAERLRDIAERIAFELDYVDRLLATQP
jgi:hypothetical protein